MYKTILIFLLFLVVHFFVYSVDNNNLLLNNNVFFYPIVEKYKIDELRNFINNDFLKNTKFPLILKKDEYVKAIINGKITLIEKNQKKYLIKITNEQGISIVYLNLDSIHVKKGEKLSVGSDLGLYENLKKEKYIYYFITTLDIYYKLKPLNNDIYSVNMKKGMKLFSTNAGQVSNIGYRPDGDGFFILIVNKNIKTKYSHCNSIHVSRKQNIVALDYIGEIGSSGVTDKSKLKFNFFRNDEPINPVNVYILIDDFKYLYYVK